MLQNLGLEHVDAGVDRVREDLAPGRLLQEALDAPVLVGDDDPELERVLDRLEADRDRCALVPVEVDEGAEVEVAQRVAGDDEKGLVQLVPGQPYRAGRSERGLLDRVLHVDAEALAVAEVAADRLREERDRDDHVLEAVAAEQLDDVLHARLADDRHHRLRLVRGERAEACALAAGHDDGLHRRITFQAERRYCAPAASARTRPVQKIQSGQLVPSSVTMTKASDAYSSHVAALPRKLTLSS